MALNSNAVITAFNLGEGLKAERKMLRTYYNCGTKEAPVWELLGSGVEESSIEYTPDVSTVTDITGVTSTSVNKMEMLQKLEPMTITGGQKLPVQLEDIMARNAYGEFAVFDVLVVKEYITVDTGVYAEWHKNCSIYPTSIGGSSTLDMPIEITFSNNKVLGSFTNGKFAEKAAQAAD